MHVPRNARTVSPRRQNCSDCRRELSVLQGCSAVGVCSALVTGRPASIIRVRSSVESLAKIEGDFQAPKVVVGRKSFTHRPRVRKLFRITRCDDRRVYSCREFTARQRISKGIHFGKIFATINQFPFNKTRVTLTTKDTRPACGRAPRIDKRGRDCS